MKSNKGHILVVDDDSLNRMQLIQGLKQEGYTTGQAEDGEKALKLLGREQFDLVILDILMPIMDGFKVLECMKEN
ncbi:MAG: response regulator, partial [bacterium]